MMRLALILALLTSPVLAAFPDEAETVELAQIKTLIEDGEPRRALAALQPLTKDPTITADVQNLIGYAHRKLGEYDKARRHYLRALAADSLHKGALEYMGELELEIGDTAAARALLNRLKKVCPTGCLELDDLIEAFARRGLSTD